MNRHTVSYVIIAGVGLGALYLWQQGKKGRSTAAKARAVTSSAKGNVVSTPVQPSKVAWFAPANPFELLGNIGKKITHGAGASLGQSQHDYRIPFGNPQSFAAARGSPKATVMSNYRPSAWAPISFYYK
jgi:hypothetical protein